MKKALATRTSARLAAQVPERRGEAQPFLVPGRRTAPAGGGFTRLCQDMLRRSLGVREALLTASCADAFETAAQLLDIQPGDEVVMPSFSSGLAARAFVLHGARPVFADIRPDTLNLNEAHLSSLITSRTRAVVVGHYGGIASAMEPIRKLAANRGIAVVEDNAHGLYGAYRGKPLGSFGCLATLDFHESRFSRGEGGALLINDPALVERAGSLRENGAGAVMPCESFAASLYGQMESRDRIQAVRRSVWRFYAESLKDWAAANGVGLPGVPDGCVPSYHLFYLLLPRAADRPRMIAHLRADAMAVAPDYSPLHLSELGKKFGGEAGDCPVTEDVSDRLLRLPFYNEPGGEEQRGIVGRIQCFA